MTRDPKLIEADARTTERHGYIDTSSSAGRPRLVRFNPADVILIKRWTNYYGNPSYVLYFRDDATVDSARDGIRTIDTLYLVDDFGGTNDISRVRVIFCDRKKDMFNRWHG
jgi:hypothetical protein